MKNNYFSLIIFLVVFSGCKSDVPEITPEERSDLGSLFTLLSPDSTNVKFKNLMAEENENISPFMFINAFNGGGVAIGDINNDGLSDIFLTGNNVIDRLFLNQGNMKFLDITGVAGVDGGEGWSSGVTMADVNADGLMDIYVSRGYFFNEDWRRENKMYINNGDFTFTDKAKEYGLDDAGLSVQSSFLDYDLDGDLDLYVGNHPWTYTVDFEFSKKNTRNPAYKDSDHLYRNNGDGTFTDVTYEAGILNFGFILGLVVGDYDQDGWPDIYVANDHVEPDHFYRNNGDGTFTDVVNETMKHTCKFSMGVDMADFNNDGLIDLINVDMASEENYREKSQMQGMNPDDFWTLVEEGYGYSYMRNMLQLNNGNGTFSEIGQMAGISKTDWSWAALFADFNNDGLKDLFVTNGYRQDIKDKDFLAQIDIENAGRLADGKPLLSKREWAAISKGMLASTKISNYYFENNGDYTFTPKSTVYGLAKPGFSSGAAYGDLDNDGDLDLVVSNLNEVVDIYQNNTAGNLGNNVIQINLQGEGKNSMGIGGKVIVKSGGITQYQEFTLTRGFQSSVDRRLHFGIGKADLVDEICVKWPSGKIQTVNDYAVNRYITFYEKDATVKTDSNDQQIETIFQSSNVNKEQLFIHRENNFNDYEREILLPHKMSQFGPALAIADVNKDGFEDFYIGGASGQSGALYRTTPAGTFVLSTSQPWKLDLNSEDVDAVFYDSDGDGDQDLYVVSGGNEFSEGSPLLQDRLYLNNGKGQFMKANESQLPDLAYSGGCVEVSDIDGDNDLDLFIGGRQSPGKYPFPGRSFILINDQGTFVNKTNEMASDLSNIGMVSSAQWFDFDGDGDQDLVVAGEWMSITFFENVNGLFQIKNVSDKIKDAVGWWNSLEVADFDMDGDKDLVAGNLGLNYKYQANTLEPLEIYCHDFDENGTLDIVLGYFNQGILYPVRGRQCSSEQMPQIKKQFPSYDAFARATLSDIYGDKLANALHYRATEFRSSYLENLGNGKFDIKPLPPHAQFSSVNGIIAEDFTKDGHLDLLLAGNLFVSEVETGRADAGIGYLLEGDGKGNFKNVPLIKSGFYNPKDAKKLSIIKKGNIINRVIIGNNNDTIQVFDLK